MSRPSILFVTYYSLAPTGLLGVFKRCTRLMERMLDDFDIHLVNFGSLPEADAQFSAIRGRLTIHDVKSVDVGAELEPLFRDVAPEAVILGEAPVRGAMWTAHRVATKLGIWQVAVENVYDREWIARGEADWPAIDRWLCVGLLENGYPERFGERFSAVPPLVRFPPGFGTAARDRISIIGYDRQTLLDGIRLLELARWERPVDFLIAPAWRELIGERPNARILALPDDAAIGESLSRALLVVGKAGYNQIVESLVLDAPILCRVAPGSMRDDLIAPFLKPHVRVLGAELPLIADWPPPPNGTWSHIATSIPDPIAYAARELAELIAEKRTGPRPAPKPLNVPGAGRPPLDLPATFLFKDFLERRAWSEIYQQLDPAATIWLFDRPAAREELIELLSDMLDDAVDIKLKPWILLKNERHEETTRVSVQCRLMWGKPDSWIEHGLDFDLHLGCRGDRLTYLGVTTQAPNP